jgi:hypothetical protein
MIWKEIKGYENLYTISEYGDIKSLEKKSIRKLKQGLVEITLKEKILKPRKLTKKTRYKMTWLCKKDNNNEKEMRSIHHIVYETFIGNIKDDMVIDHIDEDRNNNHYTNLEQITQAENVRRYFLRKQKETFFGDKKLCIKCKDIKSTDDFYLKSKEDRHDWNSDKWRTYCKSCMNKKRKK